MFSVQETAAASYASARQKPSRNEQSYGPDDFGTLVDNNASAADTTRPATTDTPVRRGDSDDPVKSSDTPDRSGDVRQDNADQAAQDAGAQATTQSTATGSSKTTAAMDGDKPGGKVKTARHAKDATDTATTDQTANANATIPPVQATGVIVSASAAVPAMNADGAAADSASAIAKSFEAATGQANAKTNSMAAADQTASASDLAATAQDTATEKMSGKTANAKGQSIGQNPATSADDAATGETPSPDAQATIPASMLLSEDTKSKTSAASMPGTPAIKTTDASTVKKAALTKADQTSGSPQTSSADGKDSKATGKPVADNSGATAPEDGTPGKGGDAKAAKSDKPASAAHESRPAMQSLASDPSLQQASVQQQPAQLQSSNATASPAAQLNANLATANAPVPLNGLAADIALKAAAGNSRFEIRLDPAELGRIDVRLDVDKHGQVTSHLTVERPATLDMLRKDAPQLQQALEDAGLKTGDSGLQFSLRDQSSFAGQQNDGQSGHNAQRIIITEDAPVAPQVAGQTYGRARGSSAGVDISI